VSGVDGRVGVVVPTRNSERTLRACLESLRNQRTRPTVVVVDNFSSDSTLAIARALADIVESAGPERSAQRNRGAALLGDVDVIGFVDSDMVVDEDVVEQVLSEVHSGAGAVIIPEQTVGAGWVARVRAFERAQYVGSSRVEAARFFTRQAFWRVGGFDEELSAGEDWDLTLRVASLGVPSGRTQAPIFHDEAAVGFFAHCAKKGRYAVGLQRFLHKHGADGRSVLLDRPYLRRPWTLLAHPVLGVELAVLKFGEASAVVSSLARARLVHDVAGEDARDPGSRACRP
jgi:glycosyltransferase involved in cell wall biosynthesis